MTMQSKILPLLLMAAGAAAAGAADAPVSVPLPAEYGIHSIGSVESVVYAESSGEMLNPVDRPVLEALCKTAREMGMTSKTPVFEAGADKPIKTETRQFTNKRHWANYIVDYRYECDGAEGKGSSAELVCGCTYRVIPKYHAHIKNQTAAGLEIIELDVAKRTARRRVMPGQVHEDFEKTKATVLQFAPEVVGKDVVAGLPCVIRRRSMGGTNHMDMCITEDPDQQLPVAMRYRTLSEYMPRADGKGAYRWNKTNKIVFNGAVDSAVFAIPEGFTVRNLK